MATPPPLPPATLNYAGPAPQNDQDDPRRHIAGYSNHRDDAVQERIKRSFPQQAAQASVLAPFIALAIVISFTVNGRGMPLVGAVLFTVLIGLLIFGGLVLGILALIVNKQRKSSGVTSYAVAGITLNGLVLLANVVGFLAILAS